jgi:polyhydroxybutyrate depolymerase
MMLTFLAATLAGLTTMHWNVAGTDREALVYVPTAAKAKPPVVLVFHGHGGNAKAAAARMQFESEWPEAIVVYPQGLLTPTPRDPQGLRPGWQREPGTLDDRDLKFFDAILTTLRKDHRVDEHRVFVAGFSNGAFFSFLLWGERAGKIAAFGICASALKPPVHLSQPRAVMHIAGENDHVAEFADQVKSMDEERRIDNCKASPKTCGEGCKLYPSTTHTPAVTIIHPGGHVFPQWAAHRIVEFFKSR